MSNKPPALGAYSIAPLLTDSDLAEDLKRNYLNPDAFSNPQQEQAYRTGVFKNTWHYSDRNPDQALVVSAQIYGEALRLALRESMFWRYISGPNLKEIFEGYGAKTFAELRNAIQSDREFPETDEAVGVFFIRHFPKLLRSTYEILTDVAICVALLRNEDDRKATDRALRIILKRHIGRLENEIKKMIGTRRRGGSKGKLETDKRRSLHVQYDELLTRSRAIKKHYKEVFETFDQSKRFYKRERWREFWLAHATTIYDEESEFLALFSQAGDPSPSNIAYQRLSIQTGHKTSYLKRLVIQSRRPKTKR